MEFLTEINDWIVRHSDLLAVIGIPALTFTATLLLTKSTEARAERNNQVERELARQLKLADFRQAWINDFREDFAQINGYVLTFSNHEKAIPPTEAFAASASRVLLRLDRNDPKYKETTELLHSLVSDKSEQTVGGRSAAVTRLAQDILKREWERLKKDMVSAELEGGKQ